MDFIIVAAALQAGYSPQFERLGGCAWFSGSIAPTVIAPVPFGTIIDSGIAEPTRTIAAQFGEPEATRILFQRVAVPRRLKTSQVHARNKAIHRGPR